jgi:hypothetical protein
MPFIFHSTSTHLEHEMVFPEKHIQVEPLTCKRLGGHFLEQWLIFMDIIDAEPHNRVFQTAYFRKKYRV